MLHSPFTRQFCIALCAVKCGLVFEWVTRTIPHLFICLFFFLLQSFHTLHLYEVCWKAHCDPIIYCFIKNRPTFLYTRNLFLWSWTFWRTKWVSLKFATNRNAQKHDCIFFASSISNANKTYCCKNWVICKWIATGGLRKSLKAFQSHDQAHMNLVLDQSCNCMLNLCHYSSITWYCM